MFSFTQKFVPAAILGATLALAPQASPAQQFINVLTGGTSGVYYPLGVGLSEIHAENIDGARTQVQATKASVENLNLLAQGKGELAFALGDSVKFAWEGNQEAGFPRPLTNLRAIAAIYPNYIQIVAEADTGCLPSLNTEWTSRPMCHSCATMRPPAAWTASVTGFQPSTCASVHSPGADGQPSPSCEIPVASEMISPAEARWR